MSRSNSRNRLRTVVSGRDQERALQLWHEERSQLFFRAPKLSTTTRTELPYTLDHNINVSDLARAFERVLRKAQPEPLISLNKPRKSLQEQMKLVLAAITADWIKLENLITQPYTRTDAVYWFLALLEPTTTPPGPGLGGVEDDEVEFSRCTASNALLRYTREGVLPQAQGRAFRWLPPWVSVPSTP